MTGFLKSKAGSNPFYVWRSLVWGKELLMKGLIWTIGEGKSVKIYEDKWILRPTSFKPISLQTLPRLTTVQQLIQAPRQWNKALIDSHFLNHNAKEIKSIPLPRTHQPDSLYWFYKQKGFSSVKSAYQLGLEQKLSSNATSLADYMKWWSTLWKLQIPNKVKMFLWRLSTNCLPTMAGLLAQNLSRSDVCPRCRNYSETPEHAIFQCKISKQRWEKTNYADIIQAHKRTNATDLLHKFRSTLRQEELENMSIIAWVIWNFRNKFIMKKITKNPKHTLE